MATVKIRIGVAGPVGQNTLSPVFVLAEMAHEEITSSDTSQATAITGPVGGNNIVARIVTDGDIRVAAGATPVADEDDSVPIYSGETIDLAINDGDKIAVIDKA
ncbi:MAG: hypothetical protein GY952_06715 [Rhodobacteraceae bacterium]|nr:hypothetical protein [Paracoccaceae bacterium]